MGNAWVFKLTQRPNLLSVLYTANTMFTMRPCDKLAQTGPISLVHVWMAKHKWLVQFLPKKTSGELLFSRALECAGAVEAGLGCLSLKSWQSALNVCFIRPWVLARGQVSPFPVFLDHSCPLPATRRRGTLVGWEKPTSRIFNIFKGRKTSQLCRSCIMLKVFIFSFSLKISAT